MIPADALPEGRLSPRTETVGEAMARIACQLAELDELWACCRAWRGRPCFSRREAFALPLALQLEVADTLSLLELEIHVARLLGGRN